MGALISAAELRAIRVLRDADADMHDLLSVIRELAPHCSSPRTVAALRAVAAKG